MNKLIGIAVLLFIASCSGQKKIKSIETVENLNVDSKYFSVDIKQNGKILSIVDERILLERAPFEILVNFYNTQGVDVATSWNNHYFDFPNSQNIYNCNNDNYSEECRFWSGKSGAEERYNEEKNILVGNWRHEVFWAYDNQNYWKSFNLIDSTTNTYVTGQIIVESIYNLDKEYQINLGDEKEFPIRDIQDDIYCVFATGKKTDDMKYLKELQRVKFKLKFKENGQ